MSEEKNINLNKLSWKMFWLKPTIQIKFICPPTKPGGN